MKEKPEALISDENVSKCGAARKGIAL